MPEKETKASKKRRLGETMTTQKDAEAACAEVSQEELDPCLFDVQATNDKDIADSY